LPEDEIVGSCICGKPIRKLTQQEADEFVKDVKEMMAETKSWKGDFKLLGDIYKRDGSRIGDSGCPLFYRYNRELESFISNLLKSEREKVIDIIYTQKFETGDQDIPYRTAYNQAIDDILKQLKS
jgi:hypothetical protein